MIPTGSRKPHRKSRNGCGHCKRRKIKVRQRVFAWASSPQEEYTSIACSVLSASALSAPLTLRPPAPLLPTESHQPAPVQLRLRLSPSSYQCHHDCFRPCSPECCNDDCHHVMEN